MRCRAELRMDRTLARHDLPQLVLTTYFLKQSFGDCLVADKSDYTAIMSVVQSCQLTDAAAFMVILSLVTSACYLGCAPPQWPTFGAFAGPHMPRSPRGLPKIFFYAQISSCKFRASPSFGSSGPTSRLVA